MATVFLARDSYLNREVALKVFKARNDEQDTFLRRFEREAQIVAQLEHPNILTVYEYGRYNGMAYFAMPYLASGSLRNFLQGQPPLAPHDALELLAPVLRALQYAHDRGLIHRDIKPDNMLFKADQSLVLSDFGLVKVLTEEGNADALSAFETHTNSIMGTPQYMSPEQIQGRAVPASDIYSMGVVLYELLTGNVPFVADTAIRVMTMHLYEQPCSLSLQNPEVSADLEAVVLRALDKDAEQRYQRPLDFLYALMQVILADDSSQSSPLPTPTDLPQPEPAHVFSAEAEADRTVTRKPVRASGSVPRPATSPQLKQSQWSTAVLPATIARYAAGQPGAGSSTGRVVSGVFFLLLLALIPLAILWSWPILMPGQDGLHAGTTPAAGHTSVSTVCPKNGMARPAVLTPLTTSKTTPRHQSMFYLLKSSTHSGHNSTDAFIRYDMQTEQKSTLAGLPGASIDTAQLSPDGEWIVFVSEFAYNSQLQLMRVDGQLLQTLYCYPSANLANPAIKDLHWSPSADKDGARLLFSVQNGTHFDQLLLANGVLTTAFVLSKPYQFIGWPDPQHIYLQGTTTDRNLYQATILSTQTSKPEDLHQLTSNPDATGCTDYAPGPRATLYSSHCAGQPVDCSNCGPAQMGPSTISRQGTADPVLVDQVLALIQLRSADQQLLAVSLAISPQATSPNGLWWIDSTGKQAPRLLYALESDHNWLTLNEYTRDSWANVSRNGLYYVLKAAKTQQSGDAKLVVGAFAGAKNHIVANASKNELLSIIGWTDL
ncbi:hypothetical protein KDW_22340 [Dictyobacter vulcani]|uniref:non-specific serine/threonine protein kinase n=2 Tax=Dictyobacter vulcani TaxID=2607529 RepID=A0A5J4KLU2_9CHLR|nr:hypothetical protein KDW_22340 [Dictyobacter vulcani]